MQHFFFVFSDGRHLKINYGSILYIEANGQQCKICADGKFYRVENTLSKIERLLPAGLFCRVQRNFLVSLDKILSFDEKNVHLPGKIISIKRAHRNKFRRSISIHHYPRKSVVSTA